MLIFHSNIDLRCFVARQFLSQIYTLLSVKFSGLKMCECKKNDKYEVCTAAVPFLLSSQFHMGAHMCLYHSWNNMGA